MKESPQVPFYFAFPPLQQPPPGLIGDSETYLLAMIHRGMLLVSTYHASGGLGQQVRVYQPSAPFWEEPETYYDAITDILQAADYAGLDPHLLCRQAIDNQLALKEEAQQHANNLRGPGRRRATASGPKEATAQDFGRNIERSQHDERG